jgi:hypothetical protein
LLTNVILHAFNQASLRMTLGRAGDLADHASVLGPMRSNE